MRRDGRVRASGSVLLCPLHHLPGPPISQRNTPRPPLLLSPLSSHLPHYSLQKSPPHSLHSSEPRRRGESSWCRQRPHPPSPSLSCPPTARTASHLSFPARRQRWPGGGRRQELRAPWLRALLRRAGKRRQRQESSRGGSSRSCRPRLRGWILGWILASSIRMLGRRGFFSCSSLQALAVSSI